MVGRCKNKKDSMNRSRNCKVPESIGIHYTIYEAKYKIKNKIRARANFLKRKKFDTSSVAGWHCQTLVRSMYNSHASRFKGPEGTKLSTILPSNPLVKIYWYAKDNSVQQQGERLVSQ